MAKDAGRGVRTGSDLLQVGTANAAGMNAKQQFAGADFWNGDGFEADVVHAAVDCRKHGCGDGLSRILDCDLSGNAHEESLDEFISSSLQRSRS